MKLPASEKTSSFEKPLIRKGYYPAKLVEVKQFTDQDGNLKEGRYGRQLILNFKIYKPHPDTAEPIEDMGVVLPKFVYYEYKDQKTGEYRTAVTPNSAITKIFTALGWTFNPAGLDVDEFLGKWCEVNVDEYEYTDATGETKAASTIASINKYKGPEPKEEFQGLGDYTPSSPQEVKKTLKHEAVELSEEERKRVEEQLKNIEQLYEEGNLTEEGYKQAKQQLEFKLGVKNE